MNNESMRILVAVAKECREELHECNVLSRELKAMDEEKDKQNYEIVERCYLMAQARYVALSNCLESAKMASNRKIKRQYKQIFKDDY